MNRGLIARVLALVASVALLLPTPAFAAPGPAPTIAIHLAVTLVTPALLEVTVTASCSPTPGGSAFILVVVDQPITASDATDGAGFSTVVCDGVSHDVVVDVEGGPFHAGDAAAFSEIFTTTQATDARKVVIGP